MKKIGIVSGFAALLCCALTARAYAEEIKVEGGGAAISHVFAPMKEQFEKTSGMKLKLTMSSPVKGLIALEKGLADAATAAVTLENMISGAAKEGVIIDPASLRKVEVAQNRLMVFVHKTNKIPGLSKEQLHGIFTGKITNWKQLEGEDRSITVVWGKNTPGQNAQFTKEILDGHQVTEKAKFVTDYKSVRDTVAATPGAIGIDPIGLVSGTINTPEIPVMTCPIIVVTKGEPSPKVQKLLTYYDEEYGMFRK
ncbi:MAG: phosphate transport system substrate-binding [Geobacteraceae bacterium]|nr:MAG: phosphate transport system substrate-binding [Geobacteraceae bacterium]